MLAEPLRKPLPPCAFNPNMAGPLGSVMIQRLTDPTSGIPLDSWIDADGSAHGQSPTLMGPWSPSGSIHPVWGHGM